MEALNKIRNKMNKMPFMNPTDDDLTQTTVKFFKKGIDYLKGDSFKTTRWAECIVTGNKDDILIVNKPAMSAIRMHYHDVVSLVGPPGVGKSTLASTIYNVLRGNRDEYFKASNSMEGFTKGVWSLRERIKAPYNDKDAINVLDLEGLEDKDIIHYFVVVVMALSKVVILMANYNGSPRFKFDIFRTLQAGIRVYKENNIRVPKPIVYVQVPFNNKKMRPKKKFDLNGGKVDHAGLIKKITTEYPDLKDFDIRLFGLPIFENGNDADSDSDSDDSDDSDTEDEKDNEGNTNEGYNNDARFDDKYVSTVKGLIKELKDIDEGVRIEERVNYAYGVVAALNKHQPAIVIDVNLKFLKAEIEKCANEIKSNAITKIRRDAEQVRMNKMMGYKEFCKLVSPPDGKYRYGKDIKTQAMKLSYYDSGRMQHKKIIQGFDDEKKYYIEVDQHCQDIYNMEESRMKSKMKADAEELMATNLESFKLFLDTEINTYAKQIKRDGDTSMPVGLRTAAQEHARRLKSDITKKTNDVVKIPPDYLSMDVLNQKWNKKIADLIGKWQRMKEKEDERARELRRIKMEKEKAERERCQQLRELGRDLYKDHNASLESLINKEINTAINTIKFNGHTSMPSAVRSKINSKARELRQIMENSTEGKYGIPSDYLGSLGRLNMKWETKVNDLKTAWQAQKAKALNERRKVMTTGDHVCPSCSDDHSPGVSHLKCPKREDGGERPIWYWVDGPSYTSVCDTCKEMQSFKSVCCASCSTTLKAKIIPTTFGWKQ